MKDQKRNNDQMRAEGPVRPVRRAVGVATLYWQMKFHLFQEYEC